MNIDEISSTLPNGFHDAWIRGIAIDYVKREATLMVRVDLCSEDAPHNENSYRGGVLKLSGLLYCVIEPPDISLEQDGLSEDGELWVTADSSDFGELPSFPKLPEPLPESGFRHWFFIDTYNCFIYLAALNAGFEWE